MTTKDEIEQLFRSNYRPMLVLANKMLHDEEAARDVVHDVFSSIFDKSLASVNTTYLLNAVRYLCLKQIRSFTIRERFVKSYSLEIDETEPDDWPNEEDIKKLNCIIDNHLSQKTRDVLKLKFIKHLKYKEIARELAISEVAVYKHLRHALTVLRQYFDNDER
ncbi:MAG: sigma-70 family RNA polymerase sigma factor [Muribaculaceae bacterium]|nr:sigma-70 family RNA polymerase sigma factor [Muribaculaceae bacterium]